MKIKLENVSDYSHEFFMALEFYLFQNKISFDFNHDKKQIEGIDLNTLKEWNVKIGKDEIIYNGDNEKVLNALKSAVNDMEEFIKEMKIELYDLEEVDIVKNDNNNLTNKFKIKG